MQLVPSIQKKNKAGTKWILIVCEGYSGKKKNRQTKTFHGTEKQAEKAAILFEEEVKSGKYRAASKKYKFTQFVEMWVKDYGEKHLEPKTLDRYIEMLETRILPAIGHMRLDKIKPMTVNRLMVDIAEMPRLDKKPGKISVQTVKHHFRCLSAILQDAVDWDVISENPCARVKPPKVPKSRVKVYDEEETSAFLAALESAPLKHRTLIWLEIATGLREGEIMGLEWQDIDFEKGTLKVERASQYLPGKGTFEKGTKTEESQRTLALPENVMTLLKQYRAEWNERKLRLGHLWQVTATLKFFDELFNQVMPDSAGLLSDLRVKDDVSESWKQNIKTLKDRCIGDDLASRVEYLGEKAALEIAALNELSDKQLQEFASLWREKNRDVRGGKLFVTWDGRPGHTYWPQKWLTGFLRNNNLPHCSFHSLRHLNATMSIKAGVPLKNISVRLGHTDIGTTANIYTEALKSVDREAAEMLGALLENKPNNKSEKGSITK
ncbi:MAG: site-specific integrase [Firmicutes bacterium]|nr:site-specific integrase [Bacillota bacterium]